MMWSTRRLGWIVVAATLSAIPASAREPLDRLVATRSLKCTFGPGTSGDWFGGSLKVKESRFDVTLQFDSINLKSKTARMIGNRAGVDVSVVQTPTGITFTERAFIGNFMFTTVFPSYKKDTKDFIAVTSRHIGGTATEPLVSQYHGTCKVWD